MRRSKYPSYGILDELSRALLGFSTDPTRQGLYESLPPDQKPTRERYSKILHQLEKSGYVGREGVHLTLKAKGKEKVAARRLEKIMLAKKHDGEYRLIAFDIPEAMRHARDVMRSKLLAWKCDKIQKSVYITPYVCEKEVEEVCRILKIDRYVSVLRLSKDFTKKNDRRK